MKKLSPEDKAERDYIRMEREGMFMSDGCSEQDAVDLAKEANRYGVESVTKNRTHYHSMSLATLNPETKASYQGLVELCDLHLAALNAKDEGRADNGGPASERSKQ